MSPAALSALIGSITALLTAVAGVIALIKHTNGPAHKP